MKTFGELFKYIFVTVLFMSACSTFADTVAYDLSSGDLDIWQVSGTTCDSSSMCDMSYTLTQDNAGKITGGGDFSCSALGYDVDGLYTVTGAITQTNGIASVKMKIKFSLILYDGYDSYRFHFVETVDATIDSVSDIIDGTVKVLGETAAFSANLPVDMDGSAELSMDVSQIAGTKLGGTAVLTLSNGDEYNFNTKGKYNAKKELDTFTLTGVGKPSPGKFTIVINDNTSNLNLLKGKSLGQSLTTSDIPAE
jgi:hypothetical protein